MKKIKVLLILIAVTLFSVVLYADTEEVVDYNAVYRTGCIPSPQSALDSIPKLSASDSRATLPSKVSLVNLFPKVGHQGGQESCVGWALGYYLKTAHEQRERNWGVSDNNHIFSPSYIYNQINAGEDTGAVISEALDLLDGQGVCSISDMPYNDNDYTTQPNSYQRNQAAKYKIVDFRQIPIDDIYTMKQQLANNNPVVMGIYVYPDFDTLDPSNKIYDTKRGNKRGGHAICLTGYDDSLNAFGFVNSWGSDWGLSGHGYIDYDLLPEVAFEVYATYDIIDSQEITLNKTNLNLFLNNTYNLNATVSPEIPGIPYSRWYSSNPDVATVDTNGKVTAIAEGNATITMKSYSSGINATCSVKVYNGLTVEKIETIIDPLANDTFEVYVRNAKYSNGESLERVVFPTWTKNDGQDDKVYHEGVRIPGTNDWKVTISTSQHKNETGEYTTHVYAKTNVSEKYLHGMGYVIEDKVLYDSVTREDVPLYGNKYKLRINNVRYSTGLLADKVWFPTWTKNNGQDDLIWYEGKKISGTSDWEMTIDIAKHNKEKGEYRTHIYAENATGRKFAYQVDADVIDVTSDNVEVTILSSEKFKVYASNVIYADGTVPDKVMFPIWTENNGQDDLVWHEGNRISGTNDWEITVDTSSHNNETGRYIVHVYARPYGNGSADRNVGGAGFNV